MWKLVKIEKADDHIHKWIAIFINSITKSRKKTYFGISKYEDYKIHKNKLRRDAYRKRHLRDLKTNDPTRAGFLSYYILWGDSTSIQKNIKIYKKKFHL